MKILIMVPQEAKEKLLKRLNCMNFRLIMNKQGPETTITIITNHIKTRNPKMYPQNLRTEQMIMS